MKKYAFITLVAFFHTISSFAQNYCIGPNQPPVLFNPSFELSTCCPTNVSSQNGTDFMTCVTGWSQASPATTDYFNTNCNNWFMNQIPGGASHGSGFVGIIVRPNYKEYVGNILVNPFIAGGQYTLTLDVRYMNFWQNCIQGSGCQTQFLANHWGPIPITLFGSPNANDLPFNGSNCPMGQGQFVNLGFVNYNPAADWSTVSITFSPDQDINAIAIGGPCGTFSNYDQITINDGPYLFIDNLILSVQAPPSFTLSQTGDPCSGDLEIFVTNPSLVSGTYDWYLNGNQLTGVSGAVLSLNGQSVSYGDLIGVGFNSNTGYCVEGELAIQNLHQPTANFSSTTPCLEQAMSFFDESTIPQGNINIWYWEFENGMSSSEQDPIYTFDSAGEYSVSLTVTGMQGCSHTISKIVTVLPNPEVNFSPILVCVNIQNEFVDLSSAQGQSITDVIWDFGDGSPQQSGLSTEHMYTGGGMYTVTQTVTTNMGCTSVESGSLSVEEVSNVSFTWNNPCANQEWAIFVNGTDAGSATIAYYDWHFGDGQTFTGDNATHLYADPQIAEVWLFAHTINGCIDSTMNPVYVKGVSANFFVDNVCEFAAAEIENLSLFQNDVSGISEWNFGQDMTSQEFNPSTSYGNFGIYEIQLIQYSATGCVDTIAQSIEIYQNPTASFIHVSDSCVFDNIGIHGNSFVPATDSLVAFNWNFGDGISSNIGPHASHTYQLPGLMSVQYQVQSALGCVHDTTIVIDVKPLPIPDFFVNPECDYSGPSVFNYLPIGSNAEIATFEWQFGDGNSSSQISPSNQYPSYGTYSASLTITDQFKCKNSVSKDAIVEKVVASFHAPIRQGCPLLDVELNSDSWSSHSDITANQWKIEPFGVTETSESWSLTLDNPSDVSNLLYEVQLIAISTYGCQDTAIVAEYIEVFFAPTVDFLLTYQDKQEVLNHVHTLNLSTSAVHYLWDNGNDVQFQDENSSWYYDEHGEYLVQLTGWAANGCYRNHVERINIKPANQIYIPNAFTPNTDGINERFGPTIYGNKIRRYDFRIYNKIGHEIFFTKDPDQWWDGSSSKNSAYYVGNEFYIYEIIIEFEDDPVAQRHIGHVLLLR